MAAAQSRPRRTDTSTTPAPAPATGRRAGRGALPAISYERHRGAAGAPLPPAYRRRQPENTVLHAVVREHLETFLAVGSSQDGEGYPRFIEREFRRYLDCGVLGRGFARLRCPACGHERLVAFSCKGRLCPSCIGRRMADTAAFLVDQLLPEAPYRQWVLTFPWALRFRLAVDRPLFSALLGGFLRTVFAWQRRRGRALGIADGQPAAVTFVQRFGGALNLHPHVHSLVPDGLFVPGADGEPLAFVPLPAPTDPEIEALTLKIARRLTALAERLCDDEWKTAALLEQTVAALRHALAAAVEPPLESPRLALPEADPQASAKPLCAKVAGFSLHAAHAVADDDRAALERLCRYGLRAPFSQQRLAWRRDGRVLYHLRRPWPTAQGATRLVLDPVDLLRRLAALVPAPYSHLVRYHGLFANRSRWRSRLPRPPLVGDDSQPEASTAAGNRAATKGAESDGGAASQPAAEPTGETATTGPPVDPPPPTACAPSRRRTLSWAQLLLRVFFVDALRCPSCSTPMVVLALISDPHVVAKILRHLRLPSQPPALAPADLSLALQPPPDPLFPDPTASLDTPSADLDSDDGPTPRTSRRDSARPPP